MNKFGVVALVVFLSGLILAWSAPKVDAETFLIVKGHRHHHFHRHRHHRHHHHHRRVVIIRLSEFEKFPQQGTL